VEEQNDALHHYCGVVGLFSQNITNIPQKLFFPLFSLQHRGQESAGIAYKEKEGIAVYKDLGMVGSVMSRYLSEVKESHVGIGHVRYSTKGGNRFENAQPIHVSCNKGEIALAHNGNIANTPVVKDELFQQGSIFQTTSDSELIMHLLSTSKRQDFFEALSETFMRLQGAYSIVMIHNESLYAIRDPIGFRPLYIGSNDETTMVASESCAFDIMQITDYREVEPGEVVCISQKGTYSRKLPANEPKAQCVFELIYFARPDSEVFSKSVYDMRKRFGAALAQLDTVDADVVVPVPDSGNVASIGYSGQAGIPYEQGLTRNHYAGRSFILPTTSERELAVRMKLNPVKRVVKGKRLIVMDDSLVRGTTSRIIVRLLKEAGAKEVHFRLSSPEILYPCYFGIDIPTTEELISNRLNQQEIAKEIGADSVMFLPADKLRAAVGGGEEFCFGCFTGHYPVRIPNE